MPGFNKAAAVARWTGKRAAPFATGRAFSEARETGVVNRGLSSRS